MNKPKSKHTPTPWHAEGECLYATNRKGYVRVADTTVADGDEENLSDKEADANAAFIVKAVNLHEELVAALKALTATARTFRNVPKEDQDWGPLDDEALDAAFTALAKAEA